MSLLKNTLIATVVSLAATAPSFATEAKSWEDTLRKKLVSANQYPTEALDENIQGTVKIRVKFDETGSVIGAEIFKSSGYKVLDNEALQSAMSLNNFAALPQNHGQLSIIVPVSFQIKEETVAKTSKRTRYFASVQ